MNCLQNYFLGSQKSNYVSPTKNRGKYYWTIMVGELVHATAERNVFTKFGKKSVKILRQVRIILSVLTD